MQLGSFKHTWGQSLYRNTIIVIKHSHHKTRSLIVPLSTTAIVLADKYTLCRGLSIIGINTNHHDGQKLPQTSMRR